MTVRCPHPLSRPAEEPHATTDVAIVASSPLIRGGLIHTFEHAEHLRVAYQAPVITALPRESASAVIVVDLYGTAVDGTDYWSLAPQGAPIVALCPPENPPDLQSAIRGGMRALISREHETAELLAAVELARHGALYVAPELLATVVAGPAPRPEAHRHDLTRREIEALRYLAEGFTHGQISRRMGLTETTVSSYVKRIRHKLDAGNKAELTRRAIELGLVERRQ
ncbi:response regulator transcription factor [Micromonospora azadirachtae]|uniref:Response regulator transcription factor n=1 Tax=Micromonospora azadirachtae TaxID=1970735 RepID=A0ABW2ZX89_9ACTN